MAFSEVHDRCVIDAMKRQKQLSTFCDLRILHLAESPKVSERLLLPCLKAYLLNGRNIADTARSMYLHRNTVIYRIEKLSRVLGIDFGKLSEGEIFSLIVSCLICESEADAPVSN